FALSGVVFRKDPLASRLRRTSSPADEQELRGGGGGAFGGGTFGGGGGGGGAAIDLQRSTSRDMVVPVMERIGHAAARPFMPRSAVKQTNLRKQLMHAGIYTSQAMELVVGMKVILLAVGAIAGYFLGTMIGGIFLYVCLYVGALFGFLLPSPLLISRIKKRRRALDAALPDALDLMVVCVESGLTLDSSLQRVGQEIALAHPDISKEFGITHMETRVGVSRVDALRNLGQRTGCASLQSLAAMLVQTERFGTSIAQALRVHAESLRVK